MSDKLQQPHRAPWEGEHTAGDVEDGLASQRKTLDELSRNLTAKLQSMVQQQEARAQEFAQRVHSVSTLPQQSITSWSQSFPSPKPTTPPAASKPAPPLVQNRRESESKPLRREHAPSQTTADDSRERTWREPRGRAPLRNNDSDIPEEKSGPGAWVFAVVIFFIYIILRSCK